MSRSCSTGLQISGYHQTIATRRAVVGMTSFNILQGVSSTLQFLRACYLPPADRYFYFDTVNENIG